MQRFKLVMIRMTRTRTRTMPPNRQTAGVVMVVGVIIVATRHGEPREWQ